jgi:hypothetical protein
VTFLTVEQAEFARIQLIKRDPNVMAAFILSLAHDSGPVGDQVRTFIVGDDMAAAVESLRQRLRSLEGPSDNSHRHSLGSQVGRRLEFILDSIETLVLPREPRRAFELLVAFFESDGRAMESSGDHHWLVETAFERAATLMAQAATSIPTAETQEVMAQLRAVDAYGLRRVLAQLASPGAGS